TGDVYLLTSILNTINTNIVGANLFSFLPHIFGSWEGQVINGPSTNPWQNYHTGDAEGNVIVSNDNDATIHNNLTVNAVTGQNTGTGNRTATINTGNINVAANLLNVANTNIVGSNWMFGHFNVFGTWRGNIIYAYPDLAVTNHHQGETLQPGDLLTYTLQYGNNGLAPAQRVTLTDTIPEHTQFVSATNGGVLNNNQVVWNLGRVPARTPNQAVNFTVRVVPDLPVGNTLLRNSVNISTLTNELEQGNNTSGSELVVSVASPTPPVPIVLPAPTPTPGPAPASTSAQPALQISKTNTAGSGLRPGETVNYNIAVTNTGNVELERILVHDVLPGRSATLFEKDFPLDRLAVGDTMQITYSLTVSGDTQPGTYTNTATVSASYAGTTVGPVSASSRVEVRPLAGVAPGVVPPGQSITKPKASTPIVLVISQKTNVKGSVKQGGKVNFFVTVLNKGKQTLKNIVLVGKLINGSVKNSKKMTWKLGTLAAGKGFRFSFSLNLLPTAKAGQYMSQAVATAKMKNGKKITSNTAQTKFTVKTAKKKTSSTKAAKPVGRIVRTSAGLRFYDQKSRPISAWTYAKLNKKQLVEVLRGSPDPTDRKFISTYQSGLTLVGQRGKNGKSITPTDVLNDLRNIPAFKSIFGSG
ncbi:MAG: DUF11 domain-containing protein, partial [Candidatus Kerfeldbacteria bacterium]|nr:DUF11 domain-containing protein [Candidatus Kerfeldbacteria bacterium]